jgi:hypothetical protein
VGRGSRDEFRTSPRSWNPEDGPPDFLARLDAELSPDGPDHYPIVAAKLDEMHAHEPALTVPELLSR